MVDNDYFVYQLNSKLANDERIFKLSSKTQEKTTGIWSIVFIVNAELYDAYLDNKLKEKVKTIIREIMPASQEFKVGYEKTYTSEKYIKHLIYDYLYRYTPLLYPQVNNAPIKVNLDINVVRIEMILPPILCDHMHNTENCTKLTELLNSKIIEEVLLEFVPDENGDPEHNEYFTRRTTILSSGADFSIKTSPYKIIKQIINAVLHEPRVIKEVNRQESEMCSVAGAISHFKQFMRKTVPLPYFIFKLNDGTGEIQAKYFPKSEKQADLFSKYVGDGCLICVEGPIKWDDYSNSFCLIVYRAADCVLEEREEPKSEKKLEKREVPINYFLVFPQPYIDEIQLDIFKQGNASALSNTFKDDVVVFDFETTGLNAVECCIIEIGAVKITSGKIVETFWSFVKPFHPIPPNITKINSITNKDVAYAPEWKDILPDFYKFSFGSTLVAHNAGFDMAFLHNQSNPHGYFFDNPVIDTITLAKSKINLASYRLDVVLEHLGLHNAKAHRALHDAIATAKMYIVLSQMKKP
ncbi:MAG: 3'-5' exoribonuclease [Christensenellaceae bacterium]|jgi:DNA polymerase III epsilon subunit family exonuclease|nr:3'-5' exoribonuclease [Christensenellaceae bacterium]